MATFEEELKRFNLVIRRLSSFALLAKKIEIKGEENFIKKGPNIIVGNHVGSFKDIAILFKIVPKPIFFTANQMIFNRAEFSTLIRRHLVRHLRSIGYFVNFLLNPLKNLFVDYISSNIAKVGTIPVDLTHSKSLAIRRCEKYLKQGRTIIALQGKGRIVKKNINPYVPPFRSGAAVLSYNLYVREGIDVPVTPLAIFGAHKAFGVPARIRVNVGRPLFVSNYLGRNNHETVEKFKEEMEKKVNALFMELLQISFQN